MSEEKIRLISIQAAKKMLKVDIGVKFYALMAKYNVKSVRRGFYALTDIERIKGEQEDFDAQYEIIIE